MFGDKIIGGNLEVLITPELHKLIKLVISKDINQLELQRYTNNYQIKSFIPSV